MGRQVRKQLYISEDQDQALKRLARTWRCTEAAVVRRALDNLNKAEAPVTYDRRTPAERAFDARLRELGLSEDDESDHKSLLSDEDLAELWRQHREWEDRHPYPFLADLVDQDRGPHP